MLSTEVELPHLEPGQEGTIMVTFVAPQDIGEYYRLVTIIWISFARALTLQLHGQ